MSEKSCQPEGLQPERPLTLSRGLLIFAISAAPRFALSTVLAATHTCFIMLGTLSKGAVMSTLGITMLSPQAAYLDQNFDASRFAPRPATLDGKIVGLLPNWRPSAVHILRAVGNLLQERYRL